MSSIPKQAALTCYLSMAHIIRSPYHDKPTNCTTPYIGNTYKGTPCLHLSCPSAHYAKSCHPSVSPDQIPAHPLFTTLDSVIGTVIQVRPLANWSCTLWKGSRACQLSDRYYVIAHTTRVLATCTNVLSTFFRWKSPTYYIFRTVRKPRENS